jgi:hypothetical protein
MKPFTTMDPVHDTQTHYERAETFLDSLTRYVGKARLSNAPMGLFLVSFGPLYQSFPDTEQQIMTTKITNALNKIEFDKRGRLDDASYGCVLRIADEKACEAIKKTLEDVLVHELGCSDFTVHASSSIPAQEETGKTLLQKLGYKPSHAA